MSALRSRRAARRLVSSLLTVGALAIPATAATGVAYALTSPGDQQQQQAPRPGRPPAQVGPGRVQSLTPGAGPHRSPLVHGEHGEHGEHAEHAGHDEEEAGPKAVNWVDFENKEQPPYLAALINFAILIFIYVYFGKAPIAAALSARRQDVQRQIDEAQKIKKEAEARSKQYAGKLADLGIELETTKVALASAGATEKARIVREAEEKAARMEKDAAFLVEQERKQVLGDLQREAVASALAAAEELLRTKLTLADQERVAEEFLATLVPAKAGSQAGAA